MTTSAISATDLTRSFATADSGQPTPVLRGITIEVHQGEFVSIVGPSGSGKSTLLSCLSGLDETTSGAIALLGHSLSGLSVDALAAVRRDHVGFVFQAYNLIPSLTAFENVGLTARLSRRDIPEASIRAVLDQVGLTDRAGHLPSVLSGGQQQRVAIARILATRPAVVFADEPTGALDTTTSHEVLQLLRGLTSTGSAVVMVTHDLEAAALADRVLVLRDGLVHTEIVAPTVEAVVQAMTAAGLQPASAQAAEVAS